MWGHRVDAGHRDGRASMEGAGLVDDLDADAFGADGCVAEDGGGRRVANADGLDVVVDVPVLEVGGEDALDGEVDGAEVAE